MRRTLLATLPALALLGLVGCGGSGTKTVTVASSPAEEASTTATATTSRAPKRTATAPPPKTAAGGTVAPSATARTAPAPAFTHTESTGEGVSAAVATVRAHGFTPNDTSEYHAGQTLRVLTGTRTGSGDGHGQQAFFFIDGRYIGTDTSEPSASVKVLSQSDTEVTLAYPLYRHGDPLCCPGGGQATVRFQLDNGKLVPLDPIPPASSASKPSRY